jgi:kumamolisin
VAHEAGHETGSGRPFGRPSVEEGGGPQLVSTGRDRRFRSCLILSAVIVGGVVLAGIPIGIVSLGQAASGASTASLGTRSGAASDNAASDAGDSDNAASDAGDSDAGDSDKTGSWTTLLSLSTDLGPAKVRSIDFLVSLRSSDRPVTLQRWARAKGLVVTWYGGEQFAVVSGSASSIGSAFQVPVESYRSRTGEFFYATTRQPEVPAQLIAEVSGIGRISNYARPETQFSSHDYVPAGGLTPTELLQAYDATPLSARGLNGAGETVVFLEAGPVKKSDLNLFTQKFGLSQIQLQFVGGNVSGTAAQSGESDMDVETVHEIAPQAHLVYYNVLAAPGLTNNSDFGAAIALSIAGASHQFPGAIFSISLGSCELQNNATDIQAISDAAAAAEQSGSTVFAASGDTGGADCGSFGADSLSSAKGVELPAVAPNVTGVGGTSLSVTTNGDYVGETTWSMPMLSQGSGGGVSTIAARPSWQVGPGVGGQGIPDMREVPDVSADADPVTGTVFVTNGQVESGGGTSLATPIWAGFTALMDDFLHTQGAKPIGFANPVIYRLAADTSLNPSPFHDITVGGNVFYQAGPGYSPVTGLGSPNVAALAQDILDVDKGGS